MSRLATTFALFALLAAPLSGRGEDLPRPADVLALQDRIEETIAKAEPSIACILVSRSDGYKRFDASPPDEGSGRLGGFDGTAALRGVLPDDFDKSSRELRRLVATLDLSSPDVVPESFGSGVVLDESGLVLTNAHVIRDATKIYVRLPGGKGSWADIHAADPRSDLAILRLLTPPTGLKAIKLGDGSRLRKGQFVLCLANPFAAGFRDGSPSASWGVVSNLHRRASGVTSELEKLKPTLHHYGTLVQTDVRLTLGCSGGALLNLDGELIGLTTAQAALAGSETPGGYAVPVDSQMKKIIEVLLRGEEVEYGFLGVQFQREGRGGRGVKLLGVADGSPAERAGLNRDDSITSINDVPIHDNDDLFLQIGVNLAGSTARLEARTAEGRPKVCTVKLAKSYTPGKAIASKRPPARGGLRVDYSSILSQKIGLQHIPAGVAIREVVPDSPADKARLQVDYIITRVNNQPVNAPAEFYQEMAKADGPVKLTFLNPEGGEDHVTIDVK
jgi:S1-C subfamily serine protease